MPPPMPPVAQMGLAGLGAGSPLSYFASGGAGPFGAPPPHPRLSVLGLGGAGAAAAAAAASSAGAGAGPGPSAAPPLEPAFPGGGQIPGQASLPQLHIPPPGGLGLGSPAPRQLSMPPHPMPPAMGSLLGTPEAPGPAAGLAAAAGGLLQEGQGGLLEREAFLPPPSLTGEAG